MATAPVQACVSPWLQTANKTYVQSDLPVMYNSACYVPCSADLQRLEQREVGNTELHVTMNTWAYQPYTQNGGKFLVKTLFGNDCFSLQQ